jgi:hypothetical protein
MRAFWKGFFSIFDFSWLDFQPRSSRKVRAMMERNRTAEQWYHPGPWYEHPMYGDAYKRKKNAKSATRHR